MTARTAGLTNPGRGAGAFPLVSLWSVATSFGPSYGGGFPYPDQTVKFYVGGKLICSAVTVLKADGTFFGGAIATCKAPIGVQAALKYNTYTAVYEGSQDFLPSTAVGKLQ